jgi:glutathione S-transferase
MTLFHAPASRSGRILWFAEELGAGVAVRYGSIARQDDSGGPDPANPHPDRKAPACVHGGALVTESAAIAISLDDLHPGAPVAVPVGDPGRGPFLSRLAWYAGIVEPVLMLPSLGLPENEATRRNFRGRAEVEARILAALASGPGLLGERLAAVDCFPASLGSGCAGSCPQARPSMPISPGPRRAPPVPARGPAAGRRPRPDRPGSSGSPAFGREVPEVRVPPSGSRIGASRRPRGRAPLRHRILQGSWRHPACGGRDPIRGPAARAARAAGGRSRRR